MVDHAAEDRPARELGPPAADVWALGRGDEDPQSTPGRWLLASLGGDPLPPDQSLADCGIGDGAILVLLDGTAPVSPPPLSHSRLHPRQRRCAVVGVLSAAGGMGRSSVAALLAQALATDGGVPTVAVDAHPGSRSLTEHLAPEHAIAAGDLLALIDHPALDRGGLVSCLARIGPRLGLLAAQPRSGRGPPLAQQDWRRLVRGLARHGLTVVMDCGPGLGDPGARAVLAEADQVVLVVEPTPSGASRWLAHVLANQGIPAVAVPWPAPTPAVRRVAEVLVADWTAQGIAVAPGETLVDELAPCADGAAGARRLSPTRGVASRLREWRGRPSERRGKDETGTAS